MNKKIVFILTCIFILISGFLFAIKNSTTLKPQSKKHQLLVTVLPQKQIVEKIAGNNFEVTAMVPQGYGPETYDPTTEQVKKAASAEIYFSTGHLPFELIHLSKFTEINSNLKVVDVSKNNELLMMEKHSHENEETNEESHENLPEEIDPHIWLAPLMVKQQADIIYNTLITQYPEFEPEMTTNYLLLQSELDQLHLELTQLYAPVKDQTILVYHPAFGYLARDYNFNQESIEIEGKEPSIDDIQKIIAEAKNDDIHVIFVQKQFNQDSAKAIAENINGVVIQIDSLDPDYFSSMRAVAKAVSQSLEN